MPEICRPLVGQQAERSTQQPYVYSLSLENLCSPCSAYIPSLLTLLYCVVDAILRCGKYKQVAIFHHHRRAVHPPVPLELSHWTFPARNFRPRDFPLARSPWTFPLDFTPGLSPWTFHWTFPWTVPLDFARQLSPSTFPLDFPFGRPPWTFPLDFPPGLSPWTFLDFPP